MYSIIFYSNLSLGYDRHWVHYKKPFFIVTIIIVSTVLFSVVCLPSLVQYKKPFRPEPIPWTIYMPPKGLTRVNKTRCKAFEKSHATYADQTPSTTTSTWTRLANTSSGSVQYTSEKVAIGPDPPQKRRRIDGEARTSSTTPDPSSTPIVDSLSSSQLATDPDANLMDSTQASEKPTAPIKPYVSLPKLSPNNDSLTSHNRANIPFCNSLKTVSHHF
jgi:hypothetical protein